MPAFRIFRWSRGETAVRTIYRVYARRKLTITHTTKQMDTTRFKNWNFHVVIVVDFFHFIYIGLFKFYHFKRLSLEDFK